MTLRVSPEIEQGLARLARELCTTPEQAALYALRVGLTLLPVARMSAGHHALVPTDVGSVLALAVGPKDAALVERVITLWSER